MTEKEIDFDFFKKNKSKNDVIRAEKKAIAVEKSLRSFLFAHIVLSFFVIALGSLNTVENTGVKNALDVKVVVSKDVSSSTSKND